METLRRELLRLARCSAAYGAPYLENERSVSYYTPSISAKNKAYALAKRCGAKIFSKHVVLLGWPYYYLTIYF